MTTLESLGLKKVTLDDATTFFESCGKRKGNPATVDKLIRAQIDNIPQPTWDEEAPEEVQEYMRRGATVLMVIGPHLSTKDHIETGAAAYRAGLEKLAQKMGFLAKMEYWLDFGEESRQVVDDALALPVVRRNPMKDASGVPFDPPLFRFDEDVAKKSIDMLNALVRTTADSGSHIGLFAPGTRYSSAEDVDGNGPYKNIPVKPGIEFFGREILAGERAQKIGYGVLLPVGIFAPEDNLQQAPHVHFASPKLFTPETPAGGIIELASTGITHAVAQAQHAAKSLTHN